MAKWILFSSGYALSGPSAVYLSRFDCICSFLSSSHTRIGLVIVFTMFCLFLVTDMPSAAETGAPGYPVSSSDPRLDLSTNTPTHALGNYCSPKLDVSADCILFTAWSYACTLFAERRDLPHIAGTYLRLFQTIFENSFIWRPKRLVTLLNL